MSEFNRPRARVTISFDYLIAMEYYPSGEVETPADAAAYDQASFESEDLGLYDILAWADNDTISVTIEAVTEQEF